MKNKFGFILIKPQLGENIGSCARSMKNFGFTKLHIVSPKINFPNHKAKATSVGAFDIINKAKVFHATKEAISDFDTVISLSARRRDINKKHISLILKSKTGFSIKSISFNSINSKVGEYLLNYKNDLNVVGQMSENIWNKKKNLQLTIKDIILYLNWT